jgi:hypothetical protein
MPRGDAAVHAVLLLAVPVAALASARAYGLCTRRAGALAVAALLLLMYHLRVISIPTGNPRLTEIPIRF